jgi:hypothetical protein
MSAGEAHAKVLPIGAESFEAALGPRGIRMARSPDMDI